MEINMKEQITTADKIGYLKRKLDDKDLPMDERFEILELFMRFYGMIGKELGIEEFFDELNRLTECN